VDTLYLGDVLPVYTVAILYLTTVLLLEVAGGGGQLCGLAGGGFLIQACCACLQTGLQDVVWSGLLAGLYGLTLFFFIFLSSNQ
jgi:hypothetical protein